MRGPTDDQQDKVVDLHSVFVALDRMPPVDRTRTAMELASQFLEYAAFEMATDHMPNDVAEILLMAARLDRTARRMDDGAQFGNARNM